MSGFGRLCRLIAEGETAKAKSILTTARGGTPEAELGLTKLRAILEGSRDPGLAEDPALIYADAVELRLLLEGL